MKEFLLKCIPFLEDLYQDASKRSWCANYGVYSQQDPLSLYREIASFIADAYKSGLVPDDYRDHYDTIDDERLYMRDPGRPKLAALSKEQIVSCIAMQLRHDHFCEGVLINTYIADGILLVYMQELLNRILSKSYSDRIVLNDLLHFDLQEAGTIKVRFNQDSPDADPMELYLKDPETVNTQWLLWRKTQRYFRVGQIAICLLKLTEDTWLLTTIKRIVRELDVTYGINYEAEELSQYSKYYGRVVLQFHKTFQSQGVYYGNICDELLVNQILPSVYDGREFPGYDSVRLSYEELAVIVATNKKDWVVALQNQKGVYLITDTSNGKLYIGSATGDEGMLLQRWKNYVANGHGGNKELMTIVEQNGLDYIKRNFQYAILENYNAKVDDHIILRRESWWKQTLMTRKFGYNRN